MGGDECRRARPRARRGARAPVRPRCAPPARRPGAPPGARPPPAARARRPARPAAARATARVPRAAVQARTPRVAVRKPGTSLFEQRLEAPGVELVLADPSRYPRPRVTSRPSPSALRRPETRLRRLPAAAGGGASPHSASISSSLATACWRAAAVRRAGGAVSRWPAAPPAAGSDLQGAEDAVAHASLLATVPPPATPISGVSDASVTPHDGSVTSVPEAGATTPWLARREGWYPQTDAGAGRAGRSRDSHRRAPRRAVAGRRHPLPRGFPSAVAAADRAEPRDRHALRGQRRRRQRQRRRRRLRLAALRGRPGPGRRRLRRARRSTSARTRSTSPRHGTVSVIDGAACNARHTAGCARTPATVSDRRRPARHRGQRGDQLDLRRHALRPIRRGHRRPDLQSRQPFRAAGARRRGSPLPRIRSSRSSTKPPTRSTCPTAGRRRHDDRA